MCSRTTTLVGRCKLLEAIEMCLCEAGPLDMWVALDIMKRAMIAHHMVALVNGMGHDSGKIAKNSYFHSG